MNNNAGPFTSRPNLFLDDVIQVVVNRAGKLKVSRSPHLPFEWYATDVRTQIRQLEEALEWLSDSLDSVERGGKGAI